jgi:CheY-like chemotaxis protein
MFMRLPLRQFILHIEDDEDDRAMLAEAVKQTDRLLEVRSACNGQEGLDILAQSASFNELPRLIILDLNLPGIDGRGVLKEIKKSTVLSSIPLVIFTTSSSELDQIFAAKEGVQLYTKPSCEADFFAVVKTILQSAYKASEE